MAATQRVPGLTCPTLLAACLPSPSNLIAGTASVIRKPNIAKGRMPTFLARQILTVARHYLPRAPECPHRVHVLVTLAERRLLPSVSRPALVSESVAQAAESPSRRGASSLAPFRDGS